MNRNGVKIMAYRGTPEKMTGAEYGKKIAYRVKSWRNATETILAGLGISVAAPGEGAADSNRIMGIVREQGYVLTPVSTEDLVLPGFPVTIAVAAKRYLTAGNPHEKMLLVTDRGPVAFSKGYAADTADGLTAVRRRVTAVYAVSTVPVAA